jgi:hypothetical protein
MSAQEFAQWRAYMDAHHIGPGWQALRHAQLQAAAANGPLVKPDKQPWVAADFMPPDPWAPPRPRMLNPADERLASIFGGAVEP